jgi:hypothetical protein
MSTSKYKIHIYYHQRLTQLIETQNLLALFTTILVPPLFVLAPVSLYLKAPGVMGVVSVVLFLGLMIPLFLMLPKILKNPEPLRFTVDSIRIEKGKVVLRTFGFRGLGFSKQKAKEIPCSPDLCTLDSDVGPFPGTFPFMPSNESLVIGFEGRQYYIIKCCFDEVEIESVLKALKGGATV